MLSLKHDLRPEYRDVTTETLSESLKEKFSNYNCRIHQFLQGTEKFKGHKTRDGTVSSMSGIILF